eukprot:1712972-Alexandrium_andersonii.AAC.1
MAPGYCTCGGIYAHHSCNNVGCPGPEGPVRRYRRVQELAHQVTSIAMRAARQDQPQADALAQWALRCQQ